MCWPKDMSRLLKLGILIRGRVGTQGWTINTELHLETLTKCEACLKAGDELFSWEYQKGLFFFLDIWAPSEAEVEAFSVTQH